MPGYVSITNHARADLDGALSFLTSGGASVSIDPAFPAENALDPDPSRFTRANITHPASGGVATVRAITSASANVSPVRVMYVANARLPAAGWAELRAEIRTFGGTLLAAALQTYTPANVVPIPGTSDRYNLAFTFAAENVGGMIDLQLSGLSGSVVNAWEFGHLWAGPAVVLDVGVQHDMRMGFVDNSAVARGRSGAFAATRLPTRRRLEVRVLPQTNVRSMGDPAVPATPSLRSILQEAGVATPMVFLPDDSSLHRLQVQGLYCAIASAASLQGERGGFFSVPMELDEIR
jgi:hypothetical protein